VTPERQTEDPLTANEQEQTLDMLAALSKEAAEAADDEATEASKWERRNFYIGVPAALLAGAGGVTALAATSDTPSWLKVLAALAAVLGGGLTGGRYDVECES
jgi:hypothetical protein